MQAAHKLNLTLANLSKFLTIDYKVLLKLLSLYAKLCVHQKEAEMQNDQSEEQ